MKKDTIFELALYEIKHARELRIGAKLLRIELMKRIVAERLDGRMNEDDFDDYCQIDPKPDYVQMAEGINRRRKQLEREEFVGSIKRRVRRCLGK